MNRKRADSLSFQPKANTSFDPTSGLPMEIVSLADRAEMVLVSAGEFKMGTSEKEWRELAELMGPWVTAGFVSAGKFDKQCFQDEMPQRSVYLDAYYIDKYEVTN